MEAQILCFGLQFRGFNNALYCQGRSTSIGFLVHRSKRGNPKPYFWIPEVRFFLRQEGLRKAPNFLHEW